MSKQKINKNEWELDDDFEEDLERSLNKLEFTLDDYDIEYPSETEIMKTIDTLRPYVPVKVNKWEHFKTYVSLIVKQSLTEVYYMSPLFWLTNVVFILIALSAVYLSKESPYTVIFFLAPIPTLTGLIEIFISRNRGMAEIEMSCKYNLQEVILSKMVVVGGLNLLVNIILTVIISLFIRDALVWELMLYWVTPFTVITSISLAVVTRFRQTYTITIGLILWIAMGSILSQVYIVERVPVLFYLIVTVLAVVAIVIQMKTILKRGISYEFNH
ncbi:hypothetical protein ACFSCX_17905 [Bacillus salitolerans]|uniref:ABC transporter permease n=1 Tax=Bacillus salitolerans TaxID=1437434 RepID=A0ABW4LVB4_9BACI